MAILKPDKVTSVNGLTLNEYLITTHNPNHIDMPTNYLPSKPLGITIHNTDWITTASGTTPAEQYTRACVNGNLGDVRVHFYVDNVCAWQNLPLNRCGWHAADGDGDGNRKTISIECIMSPNYNDVDRKSEDNCAKLTAYLLNKFGLGTNDIYTHNHWYSKKYCPAYILPHWSSFVNKVAQYIKSTNSDVSHEANDKQIYRIRKTWNDAKSQVGAYSIYENAIKSCPDGYYVFDSNGNIVYPKSSDTKTDNTKASNLDLLYSAYFDYHWGSTITNYNNNDGYGYAGSDSYAITGFCVKSDNIKIAYRVHTITGNWLSWITNFDKTNWNNGCAGDGITQIDAIQIKVLNSNEYDVKYRVSTIESNEYLNWIVGYNENDDMGYAGSFGKSIDKIQAYIVKK